MLALADALERENERIAGVESEDSGKPLACESK
jgi:acyl-CoA reductase-like NAD-dependent aldehyde dehydrogenase